MELNSNTYHRVKFSSKSYPQNAKINQKSQLWMLSTQYATSSRLIKATGGKFTLRGKKEMKKKKKIKILSLLIFERSFRLDAPE